MGARNTQIDAGDSYRLLISKGSRHFKSLYADQNKFGNCILFAEILEEKIFKKQFRARTFSKNRTLLL